jgi:hypothetical protein
VGGVDEAADFQRLVRALQARRADQRVAVVGERPRQRAVAPGGHGRDERPVGAVVAAAGDHQRVEVGAIGGRQRRPKDDAPRAVMRHRAALPVNLDAAPPWPGRPPAARKRECEAPVSPVARTHPRPTKVWIEVWIGGGRSGKSQ